MMEKLKVFDPHQGDQWDIIHKYAWECHGLGNNCYFAWTVDEEIEDDDDWITRDEASKIDEWLKQAGAEAGEEVLIHHWW